MPDDFEYAYTINEDLREVNARYFYDYANSANVSIAAMTEESRALYGLRDLQDITLQLSGNRDATPIGLTVVPTAHYLYARYAKPLTYATFVVPYHKYSTLEMFDTIEFSHPEFPAYYGTDPEASEPTTDDTNAGYTNLIDGYEWVRAQTYRGIIESKTYILPLDHAPAIKLTVLVNLNYPKDPS